MRRLLGALASMAAAVALASAGCEALVPKDLPAFACTPGDPSACPLGQLCGPSGLCAAPCPETPCSADLVCDPSSHVCLPAVDVPETGSEAGLTDSTLNDTGTDTTVRDTNNDTTCAAISGRPARPTRTA